MEKSFQVESVTSLGEAGSGQFEAVVSVFGNVDAVKDVVMPNAFDRAVKELDPPPIVWSHFWSIPPIGETLDWGPVSKGLAVKGQLFVGAEDKHQYADMVYAAMKSRDGRKPALREFSFSYDIPEGGARMDVRELEGKSVQVQEIHEFFPVNEVGPCLKGCNPATELLAAPKSFTAEHVKRLERIAMKRGVGVEELLLALEAAEESDDDDAVLEPEYAAQMAELLLAFPDH